MAPPHKYLPGMWIMPPTIVSGGVYVPAGGEKGGG